MSRCPLALAVKWGVTLDREVGLISGDPYRYAMRAHRHRQRMTRALRHKIGGRLLPWDRRACQEYPAPDPVVERFNLLLRRINRSRRNP